jgi:hypothetical protein
MADVFLSYARQDTKSAETLAELLEAGGLTVWWDRRMVAGDAINDVIDKELERAKAVIVLWSPTSVNSGWVLGEASTAHELGKLIPIKIEECKIPIQYRSIHTPEVYTNRAELQKLAEVLNGKFKQPPRSGIAPKPSTTAKIEFTDKSARKFFANLQKLQAQRLAFEKEMANVAVKPKLWSMTDQVAEFTRSVTVMKKHPVGAAVYFGSILLGMCFVMFALFLDKLFFSEGPPAILAFILAIVFMGLVIYGVYTKHWRRSS